MARKRMKDWRVVQGCSYKVVLNFSLICTLLPIKSKNENILLFRPNLKIFGLMLAPFVCRSCSFKIYSYMPIVN